MRSVRTMVIGLAVVACAFGAFSATALAKTKTKEPVVFGKFVASRAGKTSGHGTVSALTLGPYKFTGKNLGGTEGFGPVCENELKSKHAIEAGESETFPQSVSFSKCFATRKFGESEEAVAFHFTLGMVFHSNQSAEIGEPSEESTVSIEGEGPVIVKGSKSVCFLKIPEQTVPVRAETHPEQLFESASYETEQESTEGNKLKEKMFGPFRDRLNIAMNFHKVVVFEQLNRAKGCTDKKGEGTKRFNEEEETLEFKTGIIEAELEGITLKNGNLSFVPAI